MENFVDTLRSLAGFLHYLGKYELSKKLHLIAKAMNSADILTHEQLIAKLSGSVVPDAGEVFQDAGGELYYLYILGSETAYKIVNGKVSESRYDVSKFASVTPRPDIKIVGGVIASLPIVAYEEKPGSVKNTSVLVKPEGEVIGELILSLGKPFRGLWASNCLDGRRGYSVTFIARGEYVETRYHKTPEEALREANHYLHHPDKITRPCVPCGGTGYEFDRANEPDCKNCKGLGYLNV